METPTAPQIPPTSIRLTEALETDIAAAMEATELTKPDVIRQALRLGIRQLVAALSVPPSPEIPTKLPDEKTAA